MPLDAALGGLYERCLSEPLDAAPQEWSGAAGFAIRDVIVGSVIDADSPTVIALAVDTGSAAHRARVSSALTLVQIRLALATGEPAPVNWVLAVDAFDLLPEIAYDLLPELAPEAPGTPPRSKRRREQRRVLALVKRCSQLGMLKQDMPEKCVICLEGLCSGQYARTLPCFHMLHDVCCVRYFRALGSQPLCPICRFGMS